jgi:cation transport regulator
LVAAGPPIDRPSFGGARPSEGYGLPYASIKDLPLPLQAHLPPHAQEIYLAAFNNAWTEYASRGPLQRERTAHRVAWAAVKRKYLKAGDRWVARDSR